MADDRELARRVEAAQSILATPAAYQARRLEAALAASNREVALAMARLDPSSGASAPAIAGGVAVFAGAGSPLTQALGVGLAGPVTAADLDAIEQQLGQAGAATLQLELCPFADPSLPRLLGQRGYRVQEWQLVWTRALGDEPLAPPPPELRIEPVQAGQERLFCRTLLAGFLESEVVADEAVAMLMPSAFAPDRQLLLAWLGDEPIGGATLAWADGVALIAGSGVRVAHRRRGAQGALIRARLARARQLGCDVAVSSTLPGTASRRNMERHGFHVAYPKLVMLRDAG